jgi:hypothetical protein
MGKRNSLSQAKISCERTLSDVSNRGVGVERKARRVRKDSIVDVSVLYDRSRIMPFAVQDKPDAQQGRCYEEGLERGDGGGHRIASDAKG